MSTVTATQDKLSVNETTRDGEVVEIVYLENENEWEFKINNRTRKRMSLREAKATVRQYSTTDLQQRRYKKKIKFESFKALKLVGEVPYRLNYIRDDEAVHFSTEEVEVIGLKETSPNNGKFENAVLKHDGSTETVNLKHTSQNKTLLFKSEANEKAIAKFRVGISALLSQKKRVDEEMEVLNKKLQRIENQYQTSKTQLVAGLSAIDAMPEFEWNVMSTRESYRQKGEELVLEEVVEGVGEGDETGNV